jgi:hypothetical protein
MPGADRGVTQQAARRHMGLSFMLSLTNCLESYAARQAAAAPQHAGTDRWHRHFTASGVVRQTTN